MQLTTLALLILIPLLIWRVYSRLRQFFVRQESLMWKHWTGAGFFGIVLLASAIALREDVLALSSLAAGALAGGWLGYFTLKKTRFETVGRRYFFKPYDRFGILVCMLFAARVLHIGIELYMNRQSDFPVPITREMVLRHPLSCLALGLLAGYLATFSAGMLRWRRAQPPLPELE
ncbi:hypothetical protein IP92_03705 [Pseudoduganella flava]|uniref:DUF1453 domain-containing protein n=1 Tax=Pseudoduganella flava TaxID=871742 RepID=A0A562PLM8_9BURK|nr:hypothetical protein [Pseudoduganella flava]QGZ40986.1 hypothetical protein GO485_19190 [Pseudoduganella flava]TWI45327.1 hypothetical protein IP92_03705 [Pseudoduganella flava]